MAFQFLFSRPERDFNRQEIVAMDDEDSAFEDANTQTTTPLSAIAEAFEELSQSVNVYHNKNNIRTDGLRLKPFCDACSLVSVLFGCLGIAFKFAEYEYCSKPLLFKRSSVNSLRRSLCTIPYMGSQDSSFNWDVCSPNAGTTSLEAE